MTLQAAFPPNPPPLPPPGSDVVRMMQEFQQAILAREAQQMAIMANKWIEVEKALSTYIDDLILEINRLAEEGKRISRWKILQLDRYNVLKMQIQEQYRWYATEFASDFVTIGQSEIAQMGLNEAAQMIQASYMQDSILAGRWFNRLPVDATQFMVGNTVTGTPIEQLLLARVAYDEELQLRVINTLVESTALGRNPRVTARLIADNLTDGLNKAMQIARTEQLRVYRESTRTQYIESGVVTKYKRISAKDSRVCPACLFADGMIYDVSTEFEEHPQGRCSLIPVLVGIDEPEWQLGKDWFKEQNENVQVQILGRGRYDAWLEGKIGLEDVVTRKHNETYGNMLVPTPLKDLVPAEEKDPLEEKE